VGDDDLEGGGGEVVRVSAVRNCSAGARSACGVFVEKSGGMVTCVRWRLGAEREEVEGYI
jgi:hypothetical protein